MAAAREHRRVPIPLRARLEDLRRGLVPLLVWLLAGAGALWLWMGHLPAPAIHGLASAREVTLTAALEGRVQELFVRPFEEVERGASIAIFDPALLDARIATARRRIEELEARVEAARARRAAEQARLGAEGLRDWTGELRRFQMDEVDLVLDSLQIGVALESDRIRQLLLLTRRERAANLAEVSAGAHARAEDYDLQAREVAARIAANERLLAANSERLAAARARLAAFRSAQPSPPPEDEGLYAGLRAAVAVETARLAELGVQRAALLVRSPLRGRVLRVLASAGQTMEPGQPLAVVTAEVTDEILAYLPESLRGIKTGRAVEISLAQRRDLVLRGRIEELSPAIEALPERLWRNPRIPEFGRAARVRTEAPCELIAGERVRVRLLPVASSRVNP